MKPATGRGPMYLISSATPAGRSLCWGAGGSPAAASESCEANTERSAESNPAASRFATARWKCSGPGNEATASRMIGKDGELSAMPILSFVLGPSLMLPLNTGNRRPSPMNEFSPPAPSPVMAQYLDIKEANPGCLLFFRMGDFFELFFDDAVAAAQALDIALTKRGRHEGADIPMCGVPVHTAEVYLARLIRAGFKVAICDQIEDPAEAKRRGAKMLRRAVVRVVTPGTLTEEGLLDARRHNYLAGLAEAGGEMGLAWLDLSTGVFALAPTTELALAGDLARISPGEILLPERLLTRPALFELLAEWKPALTSLPDPRFESDAGRRRLQEFYGVEALDGFGNFGRAEIAAGGALVDYVGLTQKGRAAHLYPPRRVVPGSVMQIDAATRRNLELVTTLSGERKGSL